MAEHATLFFSGVFAGAAMTAENPEIALQGGAFAAILYLIAWGLHRGSNT